MLYDRLLRPLLFRLDPERAHHLGIAALRAAGLMPGLSRALIGARADADPRLAQKLWDLDFPNPLGLAAGFDKDGVALPGFAALGFGFLEAGTVTPKAQPGNDKPRIFRLPEDRALINRLGFNNAGAAAMAARLTRVSAAKKGSIPLGINLGKNKITPAEAAVEDYRESARLLQSCGDYFVINVSSPNTPGLRDLQAPAQLAALVAAVRGEIGGKPLLVKFAPDLGDDELAGSLRASESAGAAGFILTNTTLARAGLKSPAASETGGLSGAPLAARALAALKALRPVTKLPLIGVGGVMTSGDLFARLSAGANLCQGYTGLIYGGPDWPGGLLRGLGARLDRLGMKRIGELIGSNAADPLAD
jgi:dihydroorotate dehydrogenase